MKYTSLRSVGLILAILGWIQVVTAVIATIALFPAFWILAPSFIIVNLILAVLLFSARDIVRLAVDVESHLGYLAACKRQEMSPAMRKRTREFEETQSAPSEIPDSAVHVVDPHFDIDDLMNG